MRSVWPRSKAVCFTSVSRKQTALNPGQTNRISLTHDLDLDLQSPASLVRTYSRGKDQGQMSVGSKGTLDTNGWMEAIALSDVLMRSVKIQCLVSQFKFWDIFVVIFWFTVLSCNSVYSINGVPVLWDQLDRCVWSWVLIYCLFFSFLFAVCYYMYYKISFWFASIASLLYAFCFFLCDDFDKSTNSSVT